MGIRGRAIAGSKAALAEALYRTSLLGLLRNRVVQTNASILLYHRVVDESDRVLDYSPTGMIIRRRLFEDQMAYLKKHYQPIPLTALVEQVKKGGTLAPGLCAVSFDDGWLDNYTHAFPVLQKYDIPCTIFLTTNFIENKPWFWEERFKYILAQVLHAHRDGTISPRDESSVRNILVSCRLEELLGLSLPRFRQRLSLEVKDLRSRPANHREQIMHTLEQLVSLPSLLEPRRFMNWDEVREMSAAGVDFGAHTLSHVNLELCTAEQADKEIRGSKEAIEKSLMKRCALLAYPFGKNIVQVHDMAASAGFRAAFTINPGLVKAGDSAMTMKRIDISENSASTVPIFACRAMHLFGFY